VEVAVKSEEREDKDSAKIEKNLEFKEEAKVLIITESAEMIVRNTDVDVVEKFKGLNKENRDECVNNKVDVIGDVEDILVDTFLIMEEVIDEISVMILKVDEVILPVDMVQEEDLSFIFPISWVMGDDLMIDDIGIYELDDDFGEVIEGIKERSEDIVEDISDIKERGEVVKVKMENIERSDDEMADDVSEDMEESVLVEDMKIGGSTSNTIFCREIEVGGDDGDGRERGKSEKNDMMVDDGRERGKTEKSDGKDGDGRERGKTEKSEMIVGDGRERGKKQVKIDMDNGDVRVDPERKERRDVRVDPERKERRLIEWSNMSMLQMTKRVVVEFKRGDVT